ncbi:peptidase S8 [Hyunsoonleella flava]|uniref:Peptidase S8 n=1 Tax=Hyunsoonleella flava TaxID=2527939 RepID=A0A4Q9FF12_9FLAO|nr:S8 family peptidase [Hyunsoonleella flava]TBN03999.1 peptidase S8 [Hyunsoonleella flava]
MRTIKQLAFIAVLSALLSGCGSTGAILLTPEENIDAIPLKVSDLTEAEKQNWGHLDLLVDTIPGMSVDKAYTEIIKNRKGKKVIVAVIDSGIDIDHEDLDANIWTNKDEKPGNGKDDDKNGYIDDVHGWNFLGDTYDEQLEFVRILSSGNSSHPDYARAQVEYQKMYEKYTGLKTQYDQIHQQVKNANQTLIKHFGKKDYTQKEVAAIKTENQELNQAKQIAQFMFSNGAESMSEVVEDIEASLKSITERLNIHLNKNLKGRKTGDDPDDFNQKYYGNGNVKPAKKDEIHGTHVAGVIAAERNNGKGVNGVANNVEIMSIRAVPNGDEYDKDVALAIRYAVDNGASIINGSFGKSFSPHSDWVRDAIAYAAEKDVVFIHAAGNDSKNVDTEPSFPDDNINGKEISDSYIRVGALSWKYGSNLLATFSNYGKQNVDIFAPGYQIYSPKPNNEYDYIDGTSFAAPAVAGVAALIRSYYPKLSAAQVKKIILDSGLDIKTKVIVGGNSENIKPFADVVKSGKIVNAYNALIMASKMAN